MIFFSLCSDIHHLALHLHHLQSPHAVFVQQSPHTHTHNLQLLHVSTSRFACLILRSPTLASQFLNLSPTLLWSSPFSHLRLHPLLSPLPFITPIFQPYPYHNTTQRILLICIHPFFRYSGFFDSTPPCHALYLFFWSLSLSKQPFAFVFSLFLPSSQHPLFHFVRVCTLRRYGYVRADLLLLESSSSSLLVHTCMHRPLRLLRVIDRLWNLFRFEFGSLEVLLLSVAMVSSC